MINVYLYVIIAYSSKPVYRKRLLVYLVAPYTPKNL